MAKARTVHRCSECGSPAPSWLGRCPVCGEWGTLVEEAVVATTSGAVVRAPAAALARPITDDDERTEPARPTGVAELDRVLGGGLVPGSVTLVGGEPGIGKSTLVLQALSAIAADRSGGGAPCLLVTAEESRGQVRARAERLGALTPELWLLPETSLPVVLDRVERVRPQVLAVDSIQTLHDPDLDGAPGSVSQVRECAHRLVRLAKETGVAVVLVGHVTKDGTLAGPRVLEHVVDTVLAFEGDRHHALRLLRAVKHRFGPTAELGVLEMTGAGLVGVDDPSAMFLTDRRPGAPGSMVTALMEGARPLLVEVQALVAGAGPVPRRSAQGFDSARLAMLLGVLERRGGVPVHGFDVYASAAGGVRVAEPGADLALVLALVSSLADRGTDEHVVALGEVGLGGELRQVAHTGRRLAEAARLGFRRAIVPPSAPDVEGITLLRAGTVADALVQAGLDDWRDGQGSGFVDVEYPAHVGKDPGGTVGRRSAVPRAARSPAPRGSGHSAA